MQHVKKYDEWEKLNEAYHFDPHWKNKTYDDELSVDEIRDRITNRDKLVPCAKTDAINGLGDNDYSVLPLTFWYVDDPDNPCFNVMIQCLDDKYIFSATNHFIVDGIDNWEDVIDAGIRLPNLENKDALIKDFDNLEDAVQHMKEFLKTDNIFYYDSKNNLLSSKNTPPKLSLPHHMN